MGGEGEGGDLSFVFIRGGGSFLCVVGEGELNTDLGNHKNKKATFSEMGHVRISNDYKLGVSINEPIAFEQSGAFAMYTELSKSIANGVIRGADLQNCNSAKSGIYLVSANNGAVNNAPAQNGILCSFIAKDGYVMQFFADYTGAHLWQRVHWGLGSAWSDWLAIK